VPELVRVKRMIGPVLVYGNEELIQRVKASNLQAKAVEDFCHKDLNAMCAGVNGLFPVLTTSNINEMRGHDYRSHKPITLILCKQFRCERDY